MDDLISRQAAIDALHMHLMYRMGTDSNKKRLDEWINNLPPAQPTIEPRVRGEWITNGYGAVICSKCNWPAPMIMTGCLVNRHLEYDKSDFCWHCGADMRGGQNGPD